MMSQEKLLSEMLGYLEYKNNVRRHYKKNQEVEYRYGVIGETINTIIDGELETTFTIPDDGIKYIVIKNIKSEFQEEYVVKEEKFKVRYDIIEEPNDTYGRAMAKGEIVGIIANHSIIYHIFGGVYNKEKDRREAKFVASWGEEMLLVEGDIIALPYPAMNEVYRIERKAFESTYEPCYRDIGDCICGISDILYGNTGTDKLKLLKEFRQKLVESFTLESQ